MRFSVFDRDVDMLHGNLLGAVAKFAIPLAITGILQLLFNAADMIVVGRFVGPTALAAVGSTGSLIALLTNFFMGFSVGTGVLVARNFGSENRQGVEKGVHTSVALSAVSGLFVSVLGLIFARPMLEVMSSPADVIDQAALYLRIYFLGMPFTMMYNFGAAILRAVGDTRRPLYYLTTAGAANLVMNVVFVVVFGMGVVGVALATAISQVLAFVLVFGCLLRTDRWIRLEIRRIRADMDTLRELIRIGLPAGLQSTLFSISNVIIQSSVNSFLSMAMAANSAASNIESFTYTINNAMYQAAMTFTSQNVGAGQKWRIKPIMAACFILELAVGVFVSGMALLFASPLLSLYTDDPEVIRIGILRMQCICLFIPVCGLMDGMVGILRGMGYSIMPMLVSLTGICVFRLGWIFTVFTRYHTLPILYASYPISWTITLLIHFACFLFALRKPAWKETREGKTFALR